MGEQVSVVMCNDMVICVVKGSEYEIALRVEHESNEYFNSNPNSWVSVYPKNWNSLTRHEQRYRQWESYRKRTNWRAVSAVFHDNADDR